MTLGVAQRRLLYTVQFRDREARFDHPTFNRLARLGLVEGKPLHRRDGRLSANYAWRITDRGRQALNPTPKTPGGRRAPTPEDPTSDAPAAVPAGVSEPAAQSELVARGTNHTGTGDARHD